MANGKESGSARRQEGGGVEPVADSGGWSAWSTWHDGRRRRKATSTATSRRHASTKARYRSSEIVPRRGPMLKSRTASILALTRRVEGGRRGQWCAICQVPSHAVIGSAHRATVSASDIIAIQAVLIGAHETSAHSMAEISRRGTTSSTDAVASLRSIGVSWSSTTYSLLSTCLPVPATGAESVLHRCNGRSGLVGQTTPSRTATDCLARTTRLSNLQSRVVQTCLCRELSRLRRGLGRCRLSPLSSLHQPGGGRSSLGRTHTPIGRTLTSRLTCKRIRGRPQESSSLSYLTRCNGLR